MSRIAMPWGVIDLSYVRAGFDQHFDARGVSVPSGTYQWGEPSTLLS